MRVEKLQPSVWPSRGWRIQWELSEYPINHVVNVYRSASPNGPWKKIGDSLNINTVMIEDDTVPSWEGVFQEYFYYLDVRDDADEIVCQSIATDGRGVADRITAEIIRQNELRLYGANGHPGYYGAWMAVYKKFKHGTPCHYCRSPNGMVGLVVRCEQCAGSGFLEGWANPILARFQSLAGDTWAKQVTITGEREEMTNPFWGAAFPAVDPGDVLVEKGTTRRWVVRLVELSRPNGVITSQRITCALMDTQKFESSVLKYPGEP